jgi:hypothetical protein
LVNFYKDLINYLRYKKKESEYDICFFCETSFIYQYLEPYIEKKLKKKKVLLILFENIQTNYLDKDSTFVFKTNFFREVVFLTLNVKYLYSSTPELNDTIFKRSKLYKCKYIYLQHSPVSLTMIYSSKAFNKFDAIQVISKFQYDEMLEIKNRYNLKIKIFKSRYLFVKKHLNKKDYAKKDADLLIAPSWNSSFFKLECHKILRDLLINNDITYKIRPHPMSYIKEEISKKDLLNLGMKIDESQYIDFNKYNFFISDWSGLFIEYALIFKRKSYLINTPKKIVNKNFENYKSRPVEILLRDTFCKTYEIKEIKSIIEDICKLKNKPHNISQINEDKNIEKVLIENFY